MTPAKPAGSHQILLMTVACQHDCSLQTLEEASSGLSRFEYDLQMRTQGSEFHVGLMLQNKVRGCRAAGSLL